MGAGWRRELEELAKDLGNCLGKAALAQTLGLHMEGSAAHEGLCLWACEQRQLQEHNSLH